MTAPSSNAAPPPAGRRQRHRASLLWRLVGPPLHGILDFLNRLGRHWFLLLVLLGTFALAMHGDILLPYGVAYLFREDTPLSGTWIQNLLHSPSFFSELFAMLLTGAAWVFAVDIDKSTSVSASHHDDDAPFYAELASLGIRIVLLGLLPLLALMFPASAAIPKFQQGELTRALLGWLAGLVLTLMVLSMADLVGSGLVAVFGPFGRTAARIAKGPAGWRRRVFGWFAWENLIWRVVILWTTFVLTWVALSLLAVQLPAVAIFAMLGLVLAGYVALNFVVLRMRFYVLLALVLLFGFVHRNTPFGSHFHDLAAHYSLCPNDRTDSRSVAVSAYTPHWCGKKDSELPLAHAPQTLLAASEEMMSRPFAPRVSLRAFRQWQLRQAGGTDKGPLPKLVVVAISGGAYRATFWGALVLDRLRAESLPGGRLPGFAQNIRLLTGASGGMVAAGYFYVLDPTKVASTQPEFSLVNQIETDIFANEKGPVTHSLDSLSPITQRLVQHDLPSAFSSLANDDDRGRALEQQCTLLDKRTFADLKADEEAGKRTSMILSPMIAETGQPLLISNLDLSHIANPEDFQPLELFQRLPEAARELKISTAVRMSATFPWITPAGSLPTRPILHVLDAAYLDNYGVDIALAYLKQPDVIDFISQYTSGVVLVQINAFPSEQGAQSATVAARDACSDAVSAPSDDWLSRGLATATSPLDGLFSSRGASTLFRNEQEFDLLKQMLKAGPKGKPISLDRVSFEYSARASFSWFLPRGDFDCMRGQLKEPAPAFEESLSKLEAIWRAPPLAAPEPAPASVPVPQPAPGLAPALDGPAPPEPSDTTGHNF